MILSNDYSDWGQRAFRHKNDIKKKSDCFVTDIFIPLEQPAFAGRRESHQK
jgi:hypothetical protein